MMNRKKLVRFAAWGVLAVLAASSKMFAWGENKCCQCENVASINANYQLDTGNIGIGNTSTMATFTKMFTGRCGRDRER